MTFIDIVLLAASNLWRRKMRTILTVLGVIIGTACIVIMVALGLGNLEQFNQNIMQSTDLTQIEISPMGSGENAKLTDAKLNQIRAIPGVKNATGLMSIPSYIVMGKYKADTQVYAVDPQTMDFKFMEGNVFADSSNVELVVGANARQYFQDPNASGGGMAGGVMMAGGYAIAMETGGEYQEPTGPDVDWVGMNVKYYPGSGYLIENPDPSTPDQPMPKEYRGKISGILEQSDSQESYNIYMSIPAANMLIRENRKLMDQAGVKEGQYSQGYVNAVDVDAVADVLAAVKEMGFQAYSPTEWITQMQEEQARQQSQLIAIGLISLLVSAIGIANTMLASILERAREIGVMKVIGLSIRKINLMFLVEAAMIGLLGGLIGLGVSYIFGAIANFGGGEISFLGMYFQNGVQLSIPWWLSLGAIAIAVGVGVVSGIYPAWKATKMSPLEAIRSSN
ncbi:ABC transporter permease [Christensenella intestinihominis]|uniref:ABC transporter permease n=1 Tax=Christensenella intestinihominis TaxID=1851429 RepID=UPI000829CC52|nr:ABC transporter permease [Christensenella intestinihominis]